MKLYLKKILPLSLVKWFKPEQPLMYPFTSRYHQNEFKNMQENFPCVEALSIIYLDVLKNKHNRNHYKVQSSSINFPKFHFQTIWSYLFLFLLLFCCRSTFLCTSLPLITWHAAISRFINNLFRINIFSENCNFQLLFLFPWKARCMTKSGLTETWSYL